MFNYFKILFLVSLVGILGCSSSHKNTDYYEYEYEYERDTNSYYRPSDRRVPVKDYDCECFQGKEHRRHLPQCEYGNASQYVIPQYVVPQQIQPQYVVPQSQAEPQYVVPVYPRGYVPVQPSSHLQDESSKTAVAQNKRAETESMENSDEAVEKKDEGKYFKKDGWQNVNLPKSMRCKMLYMEQWEELALEVADEIFLGFGNQGMVSVAASGITPFKKGFRELLITTLSRRGLSVVDADGDVPVLEFDVLPVSKGRQTSFFLGDAKENPVQIMINTSISRHGRYMYRKSSIYSIPGEELLQYVENENTGSTPFKTYQLVTN